MVAAGAYSKARGQAAKPPLQDAAEETASLLHCHTEAELSIVCPFRSQVFCCSCQQSVLQGEAEQIEARQIKTRKVQEIITEENNVEYVLLL